jgi:hypothetical protein
MNRIDQDIATLLRRCIDKSRATYVPGTPERYSYRARAEAAEKALAEMRRALEEIRNRARYFSQLGPSHPQNCEILCRMADRALAAAHPKEET